MHQPNKILTLELCEINSSIGLIDSLTYNGYESDNGIPVEEIKLDVQKVLSENQKSDYYIMYFIEIDDIRKLFNIYSEVATKLDLRRRKLEKIYFNKL
jgi:hypothetical protein